MSEQLHLDIGSEGKPQENVPRLCLLVRDVLTGDRWWTAPEATLFLRSRDECRSETSVSARMRELYFRYKAEGIQRRYRKGTQLKEYRIQVAA